MDVPGGGYSLHFWKLVDVNIFLIFVVSKHQSSHTRYLINHFSPLPHKQTHTRMHAKGVHIGQCFSLCTGNVSLQKSARVGRQNEAYIGRRG